MVSCARVLRTTVQSPMWWVRGGSRMLSLMVICGALLYVVFTCYRVFLIFVGNTWLTPPPGPAPAP